MIFSKLDAAKIQLDQAIECFFAGNHICAITLSGAAGDIFDALIEVPKSGEEGAFTFLYNFYRKANSSAITRTEFSQQYANIVRNWLKHADKDQNTDCEIGEREAIFFLMRAIPAYLKLACSYTVEMQKFVNFYTENKERINSLFSEPGESCCE